MKTYMTQCHYIHPSGIRCLDTIIARGYCRTHYQRLRRNGTTEHAPAEPTKPMAFRMPERFVGKVEKQAKLRDMSVSEFLRWAVERAL